MAQASKNAEWSKRYRERHPGRQSANHKKWYHGHLERVRKSNRDRSRARYAKDRSKILERNRAWRAANKDKIRDRDLRRKARINGARLENPALISEWMSRIRKQRAVRCYWCGTKSSGRKVHFDHIQALAAGGSHSIDNLCASCPECNCSRQARTAAQWDKHAQLFLQV